MKVKVAQSCLTLCNPMDYRVHGILQVRTLEWVAIHFSRGSSDPGIGPGSPALQADSLPGEPPAKPSSRLIIVNYSTLFGASQVALVVKKPPANAGDLRDVGLIPGLRRSPCLPKGMAAHSCILA